jgi:hypothetical protein
MIKITITAFMKLDTKTKLEVLKQVTKGNVQIIDFEEEVTQCLKK